MKNVFRALLYTALLLCLSTDASFAQAVDRLNAQRTIEYDRMGAIRHRQSLLPDNEDGYRRTTVKNLSKLYWAIGMLDNNDDTAVEQYLFINECDLFNKARGSSEWRSIKGVTRRMLCKKKSEFPTRFEVLVPVSLGKLDKETNQFEVASASVMDAVNKIDVAPNDGIEVCGSTDELLNYPRNFILQLDKPFTFKTVPASPELAEYMKAIRQTSSDAAAQPPPVYLRLKTEIDEYVNTIEHQGSPRAVVKGSIHGYEIYTDVDETRMLFAQDLPKSARKKRAAEAAVKPAADSGGGGLGDLYQQEEGDDESAGVPSDDDVCAGKGELPF